MDADPPQTYRFTSFSLFSLVALLTLAALAAGLFSSARRNAELAARNDELADENKHFRDELGIFEVEDPTKIHAIRVPTEDDKPRKYRVYLPPGRRYSQCYKANEIPERGVPALINAEVINPGHYLFSIDITRLKDRSTGEPIPYANAELVRKRTDDVNSGSSSSVSVTERQNDWIVNKQTGHTAYGWQAPGPKLELHDPVEPFVLYRARAQDIKVLGTDADGKPTSWQSVPIAGESDGFMVWIESEPLEVDH